MNYSTLSLSELKALAIDHNAIPTGDKRSKQSWIDAIELSQRWENLATVEPTTDAEFEAALSEREWLGEFSEAELAASHETPDDDADEATAHCTKKGATTVFASLLCILILAIQATMVVGCALVQAAIHLKALFGSYNPDYDLFGQLHDMARSRKAATTHFSPVT